MDLDTGMSSGQGQFIIVIRRLLRITVNVVGSANSLELVSRYPLPAWRLSVIGMAPWKSVYRVRDLFLSGFVSVDA
jgi:hypothetical protein